MNQRLNLKQSTSNTGPDDNSEPENDASLEARVIKLEQDQTARQDYLSRVIDSFKVKM